MNLLKISMLSLMFIALTGFGQTAFAAAPDADGDGGGYCDGEDKKGGLYSACIRAHSARNLVVHLKSVNVEGQALRKAHGALEALALDYRALYQAINGDSVPIMDTMIEGIEYDEICAESYEWSEFGCVDPDGGDGSFL
jgi:hypothetical protein